MTNLYATKEEFKEYRHNIMEQDGKRVGPSRILSKHIERPLNTKKLMGNDNVLVIGPAGSRKSRSIALPNLMQMSGSYIVHDKNGELLRNVGNVLKEFGYVIKVLNPLNPNESDKYNPFNYIRKESEINTLAESLTIVSSRDEFFINAEKTLFCACIYYLIEHKKDMCSLDGLNKILKDALQKGYLERTFASVEPDCKAGLYYKAFTQAAGKIQNAIISQAYDDIKEYAGEIFSGKDTIQINELGDKRMAVFIVTDPSADDYKQLPSMFYAQTLNTLYYIADERAEKKGQRRHKEFRYHITCVLDEFPAIGVIKDFEHKCATMKLYNISSVIMIQDLAQVKSLYKDDHMLLLNNSSTVVILSSIGVMNYDTLKYVAKSLDKASLSEKNNIKTLTTMDSDYCIVFSESHRPITDQKYRLEKHPMFYLTEEANPRNRYIHVPQEV